MPFKSGRKRSWAAGFLAVFTGIFAPGIILWVLLGEFDVLGLGLLYAEGARTGACYDTSLSPPVPAACSSAANIGELVRGQSFVSWQIGLAAGALLAWSLALPAVLAGARALSWRALPFGFATGAAVAAVTLTGAIPNGSGLLVFARVAAILAAAVVSFAVAAFAVNRVLLASPSAAAVAAEIKEEARAEKSARAERAVLRERERAQERRDVAVDEVKNRRSRRR